MATVIYGNFGDIDTMVLSELWDGLENIKVIEVTSKTTSSRDLVDESIEAENDLLILCVFFCNRNSKEFATKFQLF